MKNYGFIAPEKIETREEGAEHILGAKDLIINPLAIWDWSQGELQRVGDVETFACTVFNTVRAIETLIEFHTGVKVNYLKRYLANVAKFKGVLDPKGGADPHRIAELIRTVAGLLKEGKIVEWDDSIKSNEDYYSLKDIELLIKDGQKWWEEWQFTHKWVWSGDPTPKEKQALLKEALKTGAVCVSVVAWKERNGLYYKERRERDNHWTGLERYDGERPIVEDSYTESEGDFEKTLEPNYDFGFAKVFFLTPTPSVVKELTVKRNILIQVAIDLMKKLVAKLIKQKNEMEEVKTLDEVVVIKEPESKLYTAAKSFLEKDASPKDLVSDNFGCAESLSGVIKEVIPAWRMVTGTWSIYDQLKASPAFKEVLIPQKGDVIISVTGMGNGTVKNGHCGVVSEGEKIMSNDSKSGLWKENFTRSSWQSYFHSLGGYPVYYFRLKQ